MTQTQSVEFLTVKNSFDSFTSLYKDVKLACRRIETKYGKIDNNKIKELYYLWKDNGDLSAREAIIYSQIKWAINSAFKNSYRLGATHNDQLVSIAFESILKALETFDPEKGNLPTWFRSVFSTSIIAFGKETGVYYKIEDEEAGVHVKTISANSLIDDEEGGIELLDTFGEYDKSFDPIFEDIQYTQEMREIIASLPLRDREIVELVFLNQLPINELGERLTPITDVEHRKLRNRSENILKVSFEQNNQKHEYIYYIYSFYHNNDKNENLIIYPNNIECKTHQYNKIQKKVQRDTFSMNVEGAKNIKVYLNDKMLSFSYSNSTIKANLEYKYGSIFSDGAHAVDKIKRDLRMNPNIIELKALFYS